MLDATRPEIVTIATPPHTHFELARRALLADCHVFCEKPFVEDLQQADELIDLSQSVGKWIVVNAQYRFMNIHRGAKGMIGQAEFGELLFLHAEQTMWTEESSGWRTSQQTCREFGTHVLDLCRYFFDDEPLSVSAWMPGNCELSGSERLDLIDLEFPGGRAARITLDRLCRGKHRYLSLRLDGSDGCIETRLGGRLHVTAGLSGRTRRPFLDLDISLGGRARLYHGEHWRKITGDPFNVFAHATARLMQAFLHALDTGGVPPCNAQDHRSTLALVLAAYESHRRRAPVPVESTMSLELLR
jgi:predicted dehydrogenase